MWLILCAIEDNAALWAYQGLRNRGLAPLELVSSETLAYAIRWSHRLDSRSASFKITLADGREIDSDALRGVLNRVGVLPTEHLMIAQNDDRDYAAQELNAFYISWLYSIKGPVLNRPTPQGLAGQWRHHSEWVYLAAKAGLPTSSYRLSGRDEIDRMIYNPRSLSGDKAGCMVFVVKEEVVNNSLPPQLTENCRRFAMLAGCDLIGIEFACGPSGRWTFSNATPVPDLRLGGGSLLDALAASLRGSLEQK